MYNEMADFSCKIPVGFFSFLAAYLKLIFKILTIFDLKVMVKSDLEFLFWNWTSLWYLTGQFSLCDQIFFHWAAATLKELVEFQNKKILDRFS